MADANKTKQLQAEIDAILAYKSKELISRPEWGTINFKNAETDINRIISILEIIRVLPMDYLTDNVTERIRSSVKPLKPVFEKIDKFTLEQSNSNGNRVEAMAELRNLTDPFIEVTTPWIPFLAYQKGDIATNINQLTTSISEAQKMILSAKKDIENKSKEIEQIITKAREASATAGAAVFTLDFKRESEDLELRAIPWLKTSICCACATFIFALGTWLWTPAGLDNGQILQKIASKVVALSVLATATIWCGRMYKALRHQAVTNRHRYLALQTFQAFSAAATDNQTKNAVLLETTRSIFALQVTGLVDSGGEDSQTSIIEIAKAATSKE